MCRPINTRVKRAAEVQTTSKRLHTKRLEENLGNGNVVSVGKDGEE
jgi:hypothetical protein